MSTSPKMWSSASSTVMRWPLGLPGPIRNACAEVFVKKPWACRNRQHHVAYLECQDRIMLEGFTEMLPSQAHSPELCWVPPLSEGMQLPTNHEVHSRCHRLEVQWLLDLCKHHAPISSVLYYRSLNVVISDNAYHDENKSSSYS